MPNTIGSFDFDIGGYGARVVCTKNPLHASCVSAVEVDEIVQHLKDDLDAVAKRMKASLRKKLAQLQELE